MSRAVKGLVTTGNLKCAVVLIITGIAVGAETLFLIISAHITVDSVI